MRRSWLLLLLTCGAAHLGMRHAAAQHAPDLTTRTTSVHWDRVPLGDVVVRLSHVLGEPIFLDRRVDLNQRISLDVANVQANELVQRLAVAAALGASDLGRVTYLGPPGTAGQLRTLLALRDEEVDRLPEELRATLGRKRSVDWPRLAEPRPLITQLIQERGWRLAGSERVPHDLWPAGSLPRLTLAEQLSVLLAGFDLTFRIHPDARSIELVPLDGPVTLRRQYRLPKTLNAVQLQELLPNVKLEVTDGTAEMQGSLEDHERLADLLRGQARSTPAVSPLRSAKQVYTLRVQEQPVGVVLGQLAERVGWTIDVDEAALRAQGLSLDKRVSFAVQNANADELLEALLRPAGLTHRRKENRVSVFPLGLP